MIIDQFSDILEQLVTRSAPNTRDQSVAVIDNPEAAIMRLAGISDSLNADKAGTREGYKLNHRYNVPANSTVFVYEDRPDIIVDVATLTSEFMNTKAFDNRYYKDGLVEVLAGANCTGVASMAFSGCTSLRKVELPNVASVLSRAFEGCTSLEEVIIPVCNDLDDAVFDGCTSLKRISCPGVNVRLGTAFSQCANLEVVDFSEVDAVPSKAGTLTGSATYFGNADIVVKDSLLAAWKAAYTEDVARIFSKTQYSIVRNKDLDAYTKTTVLESTYVKKTDTLDGSGIVIGKRTYSLADANDNANNPSQITFTPEALGMGDGDKLTSFTIHTRSGGFTGENMCLKFGYGNLQVGVTDMVNVTEADHDYKFTLVNPITVCAGRTYTVQFHNSTAYGSSAISLGLRLHNGGNAAVYDVYVNNYRYLRPCVAVEFIAHATVSSLSQLSKYIVDTNISKLEPLRNVTTIGSSTYGSDDVKNRVDTILTVLKSFL